MVDFIEESSGGNFTPTPAGQHEMICCRVIDIGTHKSEFNGEVKYQRKVLITWEIPAVRTTIDGQDLPALHSERFTWSFHEKASLRKFLENWRGRPFTSDDFKGPPDGFSISKLVGVPCLTQIMHEASNNGKTYANMTSIMRYPGKMESWPKAESDLLFLNLDKFDQAVFDKLPKRLKAQIAETQEGAHLIHSGVMRYAPDNQGQQQQSQGGYGQQSSGYGAGGRPHGDMEDDIPFAPEWR